MAPAPKNKKEWGELTTRISALLAIALCSITLYKENFASPAEVASNLRRIEMLEKAVDSLEQMNLTLVRMDERLKRMEIKTQ